MQYAFQMKNEDVAEESEESVSEEVESQKVHFTKYTPCSLIIKMRVHKHTYTFENVHFCL